MTERDDSFRDRGDWGADPELRALLRSGDPVHSLPPRSPGDLSHLVDAVLAADARESVAQHRAPRRSRLPLLVAAAAAVVVALGAWSILGPGDDGSGSVADRSPTVTTPSAVTSATPIAPAPSTASPSGPTVLAVPAPTTARCMAPNVDVLKAQQLAFEGTVTAIDGTTVSLAPATVFTGVVADTVQIQAPGPDMVDLLSAVSFEVGTSYLVSASDGMVTLCGFSAASTPELRALYEQAFGG